MAKNKCAQCGTSKDEIKGKLVSRTKDSKAPTKIILLCTKCIKK